MILFLLGAAFGAFVVLAAMGIADWMRSRDFRLLDQAGRASDAEAARRRRE